MKRSAPSSRGLVARTLLVSGAGVATVLGFAAVPAGCGGSTKVEARTTTTGQELQDLEKAHNDGLLTDSEYKKKRAEILKSK